ncbi:hypothetical protein As57867_004444, partial [Aphanomyces stellatus]
MTHASNDYERPRLKSHPSLPRLDSFHHRHAQFCNSVKAASTKCKLRLHGKWEDSAKSLLQPHVLRGASSKELRKGESIYIRIQDTTKSMPKLRSLWFTCRQDPLLVLWGVVYLGISTALFSWKFMHYRHDVGMFNLAGYAICTARGSAQVVLFNGFLLLWPVMTRLHYLVSKHTPLARLFLFQHRIQFHITYGLMYYVAGWVHVVAHLVNLLFKVPCASEATWDASILARANDFAGKPKP